MKIGIIVDKKKFNIYYNSIKKYLIETKSKDIVYLIKRVSIKEDDELCKTHIITRERTIYKKEKLPNIIINMACKSTKESGKVLKDLLVNNDYYIVNYLNIFNQLRINEILLDNLKSDKIVKLSNKKRYENEIYTNLYGVTEFNKDTISKRYYYNNLFLDNIRGYESYINVFSDSISCDNKTSTNSNLNDLIKGVLSRFHNNIHIYKVTFLRTLNGDILHQIIPFGYQSKDYKYIDSVISAIFNEIKEVNINENL